MRYIETKRKMKEEIVDIIGDMDNLIFGLSDFFGDEGNEKYRQIEWDLRGSFDTLNLDKSSGVLMLVRNGKTVVGIPVRVIEKLEYSGRVCLVRVSTGTNQNVLISIER